MHHYELFLLCFVLFLKQGLAVSASTVLALTIESRLACSFCYSPVRAGLTGECHHFCCCCCCFRDLVQPRFS